MTAHDIGQQIHDLYEDANEGLSPDPWEIPIPLEDPIGPPFPVGHLPQVIEAIVSAVAEETQTAPDMAASVALGTISAATGGKYVVAIPEQGWIEPVHIQAVIGAEPAQRKTQVFRLMTQPIVEYERTRNVEERLALAHWEAEERVLVKQLAAAETVEGNGVEGGASDATTRRMAAVEALEEHRAKRPRITQLITDDATPEAVKSLLAGQGGAIAAMSAESAFLSNTVGGRYSDSPNLDVLLNGHAGDRIRVDRKGRPGETVERPCLTLCLMLQPDVIRGMGRSPGFVGRGGAARLLPSFPVDMLGRRRVDVSPVPDRVAHAWSRIISAIAGRIPDLENGCYVPWQLRLSTQAKGIFREYRVAHEAEMHREGKYADMRDWAGKQEGAVLRIAGLLHISEHDRPESASIDTMTLERAIRIVDYYGEHALIMYRMLRGHSGLEDAVTVLYVIREIGSPTTKREVHRRMRGRIAFQSPDDLDVPLSILEDFCWIRRSKTSRPQGGRRSEVIVLNPLADTVKTDRTGTRHT